MTAGDSANGGSESGSAAVDGGVESGISSSPVSESGNGGVAETGGKKRSTSQTSKKIEEIKWIKLKENHRSDLVGKILEYEYGK